MKRRIGIVPQTLRSGAALETRAVISPVSTVDPETETETEEYSGTDNESTDAQAFNKQLDPAGLRPVGSYSFLGLALAVAGGWMLFGNKK